MKNIFIGLLVILLGVSLVGNLDLEAPSFGEKSDINVTVEEFKPLISTAFDDAEEKFIVKVEVDEVQGIDPDVKKCICKGTGWLPTDGGAVRLECPYHGPSVAKLSALTKEVDDLKNELEVAHAQAHAAQESVEKCNCPEDCKNGCNCGDGCNCQEKATKEPETTKEEEKKTEQVKEPSKPVEVKKEVKVSKAPPIPKKKGYVRKSRPQNNDERTHYQVVMFTAKWCPPCQIFKEGVLKEYVKRVEGINFSNSNAADFRVIDVDDANFQQYYIQLRKGDKRLPMFVEIRDNVVKDRHAGISYLDENKNEKPIDFEYLIRRYDIEEKK